MEQHLKVRFYFVVFLEPQRIAPSTLGKTNLMVRSVFSEGNICCLWTMGQTWAACTANLASVIWHWDRLWLTTSHKCPQLFGAMMNASFCSCHSACLRGYLVFHFMLGTLLGTCWSLLGPNFGATLVIFYSSRGLGLSHFFCLTIVKDTSMRQKHTFMISTRRRGITKVGVIMPPICLHVIFYVGPMESIFLCRWCQYSFLTFSVWIKDLMFLGWFSHSWLNSQQV
jgi:hypothetical protein